MGVGTIFETDGVVMMKIRLEKISGILGLLVILGFICLNYGMAASAGMWQVSGHDQLRLSIMLATLIFGSVLALGVLINTYQHVKNGPFFKTVIMINLALFISVEFVGIGIWPGVLGVLSTGLLYLSLRRPDF